MPVFCPWGALCYNSLRIGKLKEKVIEMHLNRRAAWLTFALVLFLGGLACESSDRVLSVAQAKTATPTRTRTPRPTFTAVPSSTATLVLPSNTPLPPPTRTATRRPPTAVPKPPTPKPQATAPPAPQPTTPKYQYSAASSDCEHSGSSWIKGVVYADKNDPNSGMPGVPVVFGGAAGDAWGGPELTGGDGVYAFTLTDDLAHRSANPGNYYVWIVDSSRNRISDMGGPIKIEGGPSDTSCWAGHVYFTKNY